MAWIVPFPDHIPRPSESGLHRRLAGADTTSVRILESLRARDARAAARSAVLVLCVCTGVMTGLTGFQNLPSLFAVLASWAGIAVLAVAAVVFFVADPERLDRMAAGVLISVGGVSGDDVQVPVHEQRRTAGVGPRDARHQVGAAALGLADLRVDADVGQLAGHPLGGGPLPRARRRVAGVRGVDPDEVGQQLGDLALGSGERDSGGLGHGPIVPPRPVRPTG